MNWYLKQIFSQTTGLENYLSTLGTTPDVIDYILSLDKKTAQFITNEVRKNPSLTLQQIQSIQFPEKVDPYLPSEKRLAANFELELPQFSKWILVSLKKLRKGIMWTDNMGRNIVPYGNDTPLNEQDMDIYNTINHKIFSIYSIFYTNFNHIFY